MYFQIIIIIMAKTSRTGRTLKETDRWGYDPATHVTNIAKTLKCKVINNEFDHFKFVLINNYLQDKKKKAKYDRERYQSSKPQKPKQYQSRPRRGKTAKKKICNKYVFWKLFASN